MSDEAIEEVDAESEPLCPGCLAIMQEDQLLCHRCGCPQDFLSATIPYIRILSEGYILRQAVGRPKHLISVIGVWAIFAEFILTGLMFLTQVWDGSGWRPLSAIIGNAIFGLGALLVGLAGILQCTRNYRRWIKERKEPLVPRQGGDDAPMASWKTSRTKP